MDHPEPICKRIPEIPQCRKGFSLEEAHTFIDRVIQVFRSLEDMTDLRSMYETGKQLSRVYFDCHQHRVELAQYLTTLEYPAFASKMMKKLNNMGVFKNDDIWFSSFYFYNTTWNFSEIWPDFASALAAAGLPNLLNLNIGHQPYLDNLPSKNVYYLVKASLSIIHNIAKVPGNVHCFASETVKSALINLCIQEEEFLRCISCLCLAYIVNDSEAPLIRCTRPQLESTILQCLFGYITSAKAVDKRRCHGFQVSELLSALRALAVNDTIKSQIVNLFTVVAGEKVTCMQIIKEAIESMLQPQFSVVIQREAEEAVCLLWTLSLAPTSSSSFVDVSQQFNVWLSNILKHDHSSNIPNHVLRVLEAISFRFSPPITAKSYSFSPKNGGQILVSYAPANKSIAAKITERLQGANLPVNMVDFSDSGISLLDASSVGMSGLFASAKSFSAWKKLIDTASMVIVCLSESYRLSPGCRQEIDCLRSNIASLTSSSGDVAGTQVEGCLTTRFILPVSLQAKYKLAGWMVDFLSNRPLLDFSGRRDLDACFENLVNQTQDIFAEAKQALEQPLPEHKLSMSHSTSVQGSREPPLNHVESLSYTGRHGSDASCMMHAGVPLGGISATTSLKRDGSLPKTVGPPLVGLFQGMSTPQSAGDAFTPVWRRVVKPEVRTWSTSKVASWLKFCGNGHLFQVTGAFDGVILSQLAALRHWAPEYFARTLQSEMKLSFIDGLRLIEALDELTPNAGNDDCCAPLDGYDDRVDAYSHISGCDNTAPR